MPLRCDIITFVVYGVSRSSSAAVVDSVKIHEYLDCCIRCLFVFVGVVVWSNANFMRWTITIFQLCAHHVWVTFGTYTFIYPTCLPCWRDGYKQHIHTSGTRKNTHTQTPTNQPNFMENCLLIRVFISLIYVCERVYLGFWVPSLWLDVIIRITFVSLNFM